MEQLPQDVIDVAAKVYKDHPIKLGDLLIKILTPGNPSQAMINVLHSLTSNEIAFERAADNILHDVYKAEQEPHFRKVLKEIYESYIRGDRTLLADGSIDLGELAKIHPTLPGTVQYSVIQALSKVPPAQRAAVIRSVGGASVGLFGSNASTLLRYVDTKMASGAGQLVGVALVAVQLGWQAMQGIRRWWKGEISGKRCAANLIDSIVTTGAGVGGGVTGAAVGMSAGGPVGAVVGAFVGSIAATQLTHALMEWFTREIFNLPKSEALENAYNFLGLHHTASNSDVNTCYRHLALKYHPDRVGSEKAAKNWHQLQVSMAVITVSQEQRPGN